jgi:hypothetical protein
MTKSKRGHHRSERRCTISLVSLRRNSRRAREKKRDSIRSIRSAKSAEKFYRHTLMTHLNNVHGAQREPIECDRVCWPISYSKPRLKPDL